MWGGREWEPSSSWRAITQPAMVAQESSPSGGPISYQQWSLGHFQTLQTEAPYKSQASHQDCQSPGPVIWECLGSRICLGWAVKSGHQTERSWKQDVAIDWVPVVPRPPARAYVRDVDSETGSPVMAMPSLELLDQLGTWMIPVGASQDLLSVWPRESCLTSLGFSLGSVV